MRTHYAMSQTLDPQIRTRALLYTGGMAVLLTLLILLLKWRIELPLKPEEPTSIEVELNLPPDPPTESFDEGGGGGGNSVQAVGPIGTAESNVPDVKNETISAAPDPTEKEPTHVDKTSPTKSNSKKEETPAPPKPKNEMGKKNKGSGTGGDNSDDFNQAGNQGTGAGTGAGSGSGGGTGSGAGGGKGSGMGPFVTDGNRKIVKTARFDGDLKEATIFARIRVSPEGKGTLVEFGKGSTDRSNIYRQAITKYLQKIQFYPADREDMVTVRFNFLVN